MSEKQGICMQKVTNILNPSISYSQNKTHHAQLLWLQLQSLAYFCEGKDRVHTQMSLFWALERQIPIVKYAIFFPSKQERYEHEHKTLQ